MRILHDLKNPNNSYFELEDINKAKDSIDLTAWRQGHKEAGAGNPSGQLEKKLSKRHKGIETAVKKLTKEDAEQIDELSNKTLGKYAYKAASELGSRGITAGLKIAANEPTEKNFKKMGNRQKGVATAIKKLTKEDIINKAISKFVAEDHELPSIDDRFLAAIEHLPESHIATLFGLFDNLSEENQLVMIDTVATTEGVNSLIDFAIENTRGE